MKCLFIVLAKYKSSRRVSVGLRPNWSTYQIIGKSGPPWDHLKNIIWSGKRFRKANSISKVKKSEDWCYVISEWIIKQHWSQDSEVLGMKRQVNRTEWRTFNNYTHSHFSFDKGQEILVCGEKIFFSANGTKQLDIHVQNTHLGTHLTCVV